jgi:hypothetical protein
MNDEERTPKEVAAPTGEAEDAASDVERDIDELGETQRERDEYLELAQRTKADF